MTKRKRIGLWLACFGLLLLAATVGISDGYTLLIWSELGWQDLISLLLSGFAMFGFGWVAAKPDKR